MVARRTLAVQIFIEDKAAILALLASEERHRPLRKKMKFKLFNEEDEAIRR